MKTNIDSKLLAYSLLGAATCAATAAKAQISHTEIDPDIYVSDFLGVDEAVFDLDGDGTDDVAITHENVMTFFYSFADYMFIEPLNGAEFLAESSASIPDPQELLDPIGSSGNWLGTKERFNFSGSDPSEKYVGLRLNTGSGYQYAWLRASQPSSQTAFLMDFAIQLTPGTPILAGDGRPCPTPQNLRVDSIDASGFVRLKWNKVGNAQDYRVTGKKLGTGLSQTVTKTNNKVQRDNLPSGQTYEVRVRANCVTSFSDWTDWLVITIPTMRVSANANDFSVYPNPSSSWVRIKIDKEIAAASLEGALVQLFDLNGQVVAQREFGTAEIGEELQIDFPDLPQGSYLLSIKHGENEAVHPIVIE